MIPVVPAVAPTDRAWVNSISCPRQKALALAIPTLCEVFGMTPEDLADREPLQVTPLTTLRRGFRIIALGAIITMGREMSLRWADLQGGDRVNRGRTQIRDLLPAHRASSVIAVARLDAFLAHGGFMGEVFRGQLDRIKGETYALWQRFHSQNPGKSPTNRAKVRTETVPGTSIDDLDD